MQIIFSILATLFLSSEAAMKESFSGTVIYKSELVLPENEFADLKTTDPARYREYVSYTKSIADAVKQMDYTLIFTEKEARFEAEEMLGKNSDMPGSLKEAIGVFYNNSDTSERIQQLEVQGGIYLIEREPLEWKITGETKQIAGYTCRKAVSSQNFFSHRMNENKVQEIVAWFAPDITVSFGPKGYSGLPGLILGITVAQEHIFATELELRTKAAEIEKPVKGMKVSFSEYQAIRAGLGERFREFNGIKN